MSPLTPSGFGLYNSGLMYIYSKSVKSTCLSRSSRASQSLQLVEKQPKSTPDMYNPPRPLYRRGVDIYIPSGHSLLLSGLVANFAKIQMSRKQRQ